MVLRNPGSKTLQSTVCSTTPKRIWISASMIADLMQFPLVVPCYLILRNCALGKGEFGGGGGRQLGLIFLSAMVSVFWTFSKLQP
jgi:hypothetical protein